jgi:chromate transporter
MSEKPSFKKATLFWLKLGFISFGGPAGQISIMHDFLVEKQKWISESKFLQALNYCMLLPGPEAQQLATYIGWILHGPWSGVIAGVLFVLPSMFLLWGLSAVYVSFGNLPWIYALFAGLKPAVIAIVFAALIKIGKKSLKSAFHLGVAILAFLGIFLFNLPFPFLILVGILAAVMLRFYFPKILLSRSEKENLSKDSEDNNKESEKEERQYFINRFSDIPGTGFSLPRLGKQIFIFLALWPIPLVLLYFFGENFPFWKSLSSFFTQAAFVTFGGAYAVLPYVAQVTVQKFQWLSSLEMIDGLALGETTPGPLIMVLSFVGFMAGFHQFSDSLTWGAVGLVITTFYTFLPCFFFILVGAPIIEKTQQKRGIQEMLSVVTAAVVGVIFNLGIYLGKAVLFPEEISWTGIDIPSLIWMVISFVVLVRLKWNLLVWIGISALYGLGVYILF